MSTLPKTKLILKAANFYQHLLNVYPKAFQREYGELLLLHFHKELHETLNTHGKRGLLRFWLFILSDFVRSCLIQFKEEFERMVKKNISIFRITATMLTAAAWLTIWAGGNHLLIGRNEIVSLALFSVILIGGAITLQGLVRSLLRQPISRIFSVLLFVCTAMLVIGNLYLMSNNMWQGSIFGYNAFEFLYWIALFAYFLVVTAIGISMLIQQKWLPAASMLFIALPVLINPLVDLFNVQWMITFFGIISSAAWLLIAWWLNRYNKTPPLPQQTA